MDSFSPLIVAMSQMGVSLPPVIGKDEVDGIRVSTVVTPDMGPETALSGSDGQWHPVERYTDEEAARAGHAKWIQFIREGNRDITVLGYDDLVNSKQVTLS